ncbi:SRPBCC family protein [Mesorhizobium sp. M0778]|uniref:SRPBCC family protein n=1 Tax=Mesorhizobium sp. M0778 TaxID=2956999 RepID=UPI00333A69A1
MGHHPISRRNKSQMFDISIEIDRPAQTVFRHIEDIEAAPAWYSAVQSVAKLTAGPVGRVLETSWRSPSSKSMHC